MARLPDLAGFANVASLLLHDGPSSALRERTRGGRILRAGGGRQSGFVHGPAQAFPSPPTPRPASGARGERRPSPHRDGPQRESRRRAADLLGYADVAELVPLIA